MAERKSGPVKPPVLDLKARQAKPKSAAGEPAASAAKAAPALQEPAVPNGEAAGSTSVDSGRATAPKPSAAAAQPGAAASTTAEKPAPDATGPGPTPEPPKPGAPKPPPPRPQARLAMPWSAISIAAIAGALLGAALIYLLAAWLPLPGPAPIADPEPRLAALADSDATLEQRLGELEERTTDTQLSLDATIEQLDSGLSGLGRSLEELRAAVPEPLDVELSGITAQLQSLESRLDATAAGASSSDAAALADGLADIEATLAEFDTRIAAVEASLAATADEIAGIDGRLAELGSSVTAQASSIGGGDVAPGARLPLIVSGLEAAFATGRPYAVELESLTALLPELSVPPPVVAASEDGLPRPDLLVRRFNERLPAILAGRAASATGDWTENALEWAKAVLALRPAEEMEGDSPEAVVSRLEAAMERGDFVAAAGLMAELPAAMQEAAGDLAGDILLHAEADTFITGLRAQALAPPPLEAPQ